jgi:hypothetical protein
MYRIRAASPRTKARVAGIFYLLNFIAGSLALMLASRNPVMSRNITVFAAGCYVAVTLLLFALFKPVSMPISLTAASFSLLGCAVSVLGAIDVNPAPNPLVFFGGYCVLIGYLILRSSFFPPILGAALIVAGVGWLTYLIPPLATAIYPYNVASGALAEGALTIWLLTVGLNEKRWIDQPRRVAA